MRTGLDWKQKRYSVLIIIGMMTTLSLFCTLGKQPAPTTLPTGERFSTPTQRPACTVASPPEVTPNPTATATEKPTATPVDRAPDASAYQLATYTAEQMGAYVSWVEQYALDYMDNHFDYNLDEGSYYRIIWYAAWDALMHYPNNPRAEDWFWKQAYYMSMAGEGYGATELYRQKMQTAITLDNIAPEDLPAWFKSGESGPNVFTQKYTLELDPLGVPGYDAGAIVNLGRLDDIDGPGGSCYLLLEKDGNYSIYTIHNGFPDVGYHIMMRNPLSCYAQDVTNDGVDEIIVDQYSGGHVGGTTINVYGTDSMPPRLMPFGSQQSAELTAWNGTLYDFPEVGRNTQIQFMYPFGTCDVLGITNYQWNGSWFEITKGSIDVFESPRTDYGLLNCHDRIIRFSEGLDPRDGILIMDQTLNAFAPYAKDSIRGAGCFTDYEGAVRCLQWGSYNCTIHSC